MAKRFMFVFLLLVSSLSLLAAQAQQEWVARYNGPGNRDDIATAMALDAKGFVYVTGWSWGDGTGDDYATIKYDSKGNEIWVARYNGPANSADEARALAVDAEGNVYVTGRSRDALFWDYATVKYDAEGNEVWVARYDGPAHGHDEATAIALDDKGNVYVTGSSCGGTDRLWYPPCYDYATVKYDAEGNQIWVARYDGPEHANDEATAIATDAEGNVYVTGRSGGLGTPYWDYATIKYDAEGNQVWVARYNGPGPSRWSEAAAIALDAEGNVYVTGWSRGLGTDRDYATIKYDAEGNQVWAARYDGPGNYRDEAKAIAVDAEGNVYVTGLSARSVNYLDYATIKYDVNGNQAWVARYNGPGNSSNEAVAIALDGEANVYVTGQSSGDMYADYATVKYDTKGNQVWVVRYDGPAHRGSFARAIALDAEGNVYITGWSDGGDTGLDYATVKYSQ